ncbi:MAG: orotate phosphoribosyltransferase [Burkholderiales bacterium]
MNHTAAAFIDDAIAAGAILFGEFTTKAGRQSPYFFNAGRFCTGAGLARLGQHYAEALLSSGVAFDGLFGPAYKGIPLAASIGIALAAKGRDVPYSFNRKEAKDHGEGGSVVGAALKGRLVIIDDVISAGTSVRESNAILEAAGAQVAAVLIALDRMEQGPSGMSAVDEVRQTLGVPVIAVATLDDLITRLEQDPARAQELDAIRAYREAYGVRR